MLLLLFYLVSTIDSHLKEFGNWAEQEGLQIIATRVSTGEECSMIISDGYAEAPAENPIASWKDGVF